MLTAALFTGSMLTGCTHHGTAQQMTTGQSTASRAKAITIGAPRSIPLGTELGPAVAGGGRLVFPAPSAPGREWDTVVSVALASGERSIVARSRFKPGLINWAAPAGTMTVYVDQQRRQSDGEPAVLWRVVAVEPDSGRRLVLDSNGNHPDPFVPVLRSQEGAALWTSAEADRTGRLRIWRPGWSRPRDIARHAVIGPGSERLDGRTVSFVGAPADGRFPRRRADCWQAGLDGREPTPVTTSGEVMECSTQGDRLLWQERYNPETDHVRPIDRDSAPYELWTRTGDADPVLLHRGFMQFGAPLITGRFAVWIDRGGRHRITDLDDPQRELRMPGHASVASPTSDQASLVLITTHGPRYRETATVIDLDKLS